MLFRFEKSNEPITGGSRRGVFVPYFEPVKSGRRNSQFEHITANASVITARNSPRTRSAGIPMMIAAKIPTSTAQTTAGNQAISNCMSQRLNGTGMSWPSRSTTSVSAAEPDERELPERELARPARERCDRRGDHRVDHDLGPEELLRPLAAGTTAGSSRKPNSTVKPIAGSRRTYQSDRSRSGIGFTWAESDQPVSSRRFRTTNVTSTSAATKR